MRTCRLFCTAVVSTLLALGCSRPEPGAPPVARREAVPEIFHGVSLQDPYRWMEKAENAAELERWMLAQGGYAQTLLAGLPGREAWYRRLLELYQEGTAVSSVTVRCGQLFYLETGAGESIARLVHRDASGARRVLYEPAAGRESIANYSVSPDATTVAVNITENGSEYSVIRFIDVASTRLLDDRLWPVWGEFEAVWEPDSKGVYYVQMNRQALADPEVDDLLNTQVLRHRLGAHFESPVFMRTAQTAALLQPEAFPVVERPADGDWEVLFGLRAHPSVLVMARRAGSTEWTKLVDFDDGIRWAVAWRNTLYLLDQGIPSHSRILEIGLDQPEPSLASARVAYMGEQNISFMVVASDGVYLLVEDEGISRLLRLPHGGSSAEPLDMPQEGAISEFRGDAREEGVTFALEDWHSPKRHYRYTSSRGLEALSLGDAGGSTSGKFTVTRIHAVSADGTEIPVTVMHRDGLELDGARPTILQGYGAYGVTYRPFHDPARIAWLEAGGVYAYAHVRGGGLRGAAWHAAGSGRNKVNGVRDFIAAAEALVAAGYTDAAHLAAYGGSMGGILIGRAITERPEAFAAASIHVGLLNAMRFLEADNGSNQKAELGYTDDEQGFRTLLAQDPYHHLVPGRRYPSTLLTVGLHDRRVAPWMSAKFAARLAETSSHPLPMLLRVDHADGHGLLANREQRAARMADVFAFFMHVFERSD